MFQRFIYAGREDGLPGEVLTALTQALGIAPQNCLAHGADSDYGFLQRDEAALMHSPIEGDFSLASDLFLPGRDEAWLFARLLDLSRQGLRTAVPDESSDSPLPFVLFEAGTRRTVIVLDEDDEGETVRIHCPGAG